MPAELTVPQIFSLLRNGDVDTAIAAAQHLDASGKVSPRDWSLLGDELQKTGHLALAIQCYERVVEKLPHVMSGWMNLFVVHKAAGNMLRAAECAKTAVAINPNVPQIQSALGELLTTLHRFSEAEAVLRKALALSATHHLTYARLVECFIAQRRFDDALDVAIPFAEQNPDSLNAWIMLARACYATAKPESLGALRKAWKLSPDSMMVAKYMANYWADSGQFAKAAEWLERVQFNEPSSTTDLRLKLFRHILSSHETHTKRRGLQPHDALPPPLNVEATAKRPKVAIVIPTKNGLELLTQCLKSIQTRSTWGNYLVCVADTGSSSAERGQIRTLLQDCFEPNQCMLLEYDWYHFAATNNAAVKKLSDDVDLLLFCNNDVELIDDSISRLVGLHQQYRDVIGTAGCRLLYGNGTIQHAGQEIGYAHDNGHVVVGHRGQGTQSTYQSVGKVVGNTAAFLMISRHLFWQLGGFNEEYIECFEDVELNLRCLMQGRINIYADNSACYHHESVTRRQRADCLARSSMDLYLRLIPLISTEFDVIRPYLAPIDYVATEAHRLGQVEDQSWK